MPLSPFAGKPAPPELLIDVDALLRAYEERQPDPNDPQQRVSFGTSGHRGSAANGTFSAAHIAAITQAICDYRAASAITGPLFLGKDTHALSEPLRGRREPKRSTKSTRKASRARPTSTESLSKRRSSCATRSAARRDDVRARYFSVTADESHR